MRKLFVWRLLKFLFSILFWFRVWDMNSTVFLQISWRVIYLMLQVWLVVDIFAQREVSLKKLSPWLWNLFLAPDGYGSWQRYSTLVESARRRIIWDLEVEHWFWYIRALTLMLLNQSSHINVVKSDGSDLTPTNILWVIFMINCMSRVGNDVRSPTLRLCRMTRYLKFWNTLNKHLFTFCNNCATENSLFSSLSGTHASDPLEVPLRVQPSRSVTHMARNVVRHKRCYKAHKYFVSAVETWSVESGGWQVHWTKGEGLARRNC